MNTIIGVSALYRDAAAARGMWLAGYRRASTLCFFDDHQNAYQRMKDMLWSGFTRASTTIFHAATVIATL
jgi:hypothetical protein